MIIRHGLGNAGSCATGPFGARIVPMSKSDPSEELAGASALMAAYAAMTARQRQALLGLALAMAPRRDDRSAAEEGTWRQDTPIHDA